MVWTAWLGLGMGVTNHKAGGLLADGWGTHGSGSVM